VADCVGGANWAGAGVPGVAVIIEVHALIHVVLPLAPRRA
jgi:hypothetical protein